MDFLEAEKIVEGSDSWLWFDFEITKIFARLGLLEPKWYDDNHLCLDKEYDLRNKIDNYSYYRLKRE